MTDEYEELVSLAQRQQVLIGDADWLGAVALADRWDALTEQLPAEPPYEARPFLEEAAAIVISNIGLIEAALDGTARQLEHLGRGRQALNGYTGELNASAHDSTSLDAHG